MNTLFKKTSTLFLMIFGISMYFSQTKDIAKDVSMFPSKDGFKKYIIRLPKKANENAYKVEVFATKTEKVDKCNNHFLTGEIKDNDLQGYGYKYYEFTGTAVTASTLMACDDNTKVDAVVKSQPVLVNYNSKLPIVVYVPNGLNVKYKVWTQSPAEYNAGIR